jgi:hypothetical protein
MFFRNQTPKVPAFDERISALRAMRFSSHPEPSGGTRVTRDGCGAVIKDLGNGHMEISKSGVLVGSEIALLINEGYQMFLHAPSGKEVPALATHLKALHAFDEDLWEGLGITVLYNQALGTTTDEHLYDRVVNRDATTHVRRPWER